CLSALRARNRVVRCHGTATRAVDLLDDAVRNAGVRTLAVHRGADVVDDDGRTSSRELLGVRAPETAARSGYDDHRPAEVDPACPVPPRDVTRRLTGRENASYGEPTIRLRTRSPDAEEGWCRTSTSAASGCSCRRSPGSRWPRPPARPASWPAPV